MAILGKREVFFLNILAQDAVKTRSRDSWQRNTEYQILSLSFPFH